ncbi:conserved hypothetical protein [Trichinella spiralis]|nr:conserved hypothetical protein [Trichinella spiralis]
MYHINTAITGTCIRQAFTILYRLKFICMLKASQILRVTTPMQINNGIPLHNTYNGLRSSSTPQ